MPYYKGLDSGRRPPIELPRSVYPLMDIDGKFFTYEINNGIYVNRAYRQRLTPGSIRLFHILLAADDWMSNGELMHKLGFSVSDNPKDHGEFMRPAIGHLRNHLEQAHPDLSIIIQTGRSLGYKFAPHETVGRYYTPLLDRFVIEVPAPWSQSSNRGEAPKKYR